MARREESSAITGKMILSVVASAICVYNEKLGLQSINVVSYSISTCSRNVRSQSITAIHAFVPGMFWFASVFTALACNSRSGSPQTKSMLLGIPALYSFGLVIKSWALNVGGAYGDGRRSWKYPPKLHRGMSP